MNELLQIAIEASIAAGREIMKVYLKTDYQIEMKSDATPLTIADRKANNIINSYLIPLGIPIISEENEQLPYQKRKDWKECWIVDPLDGTKEFIRKNGEFTVNIALVTQGQPQLGVIYAPALNMLYFAKVSDQKAFKVKIFSEVINYDVILNTAEEIQPDINSGILKVVGSRSHMNDETLKFIEDLKMNNKNLQIISKGSSLKFCLLAEGKAHIYPRFGSTMEWDTAAGHAICQAVGVFCRFNDSGESISYNRENLINDNFCASYEG